MWSAIFVLFLAVLSDEQPKSSTTLAGVIAAAGALVAAIAVARSAGSDQVALDFGGIVTDRATGSFQSPVLLAIFVMFCLPLQLVFALRGSSRVARLAGAIAVLLSVAALSLALTRGAFVALAIAAVWLAVVWQPIRRLALVAVVALIGLALIKFNPLSSVLHTDLVIDRIATVTSPETKTVQERVRIWEETPHIFEDHLPFGIGAENLPEHAGSYGLLFPAGAPNNAHNTILVVATEFGIPGLLALAWLVVALVRTFRRARETVIEPAHSLAIGAGAGFVALAVEGIVDYAYGDNAFFLVVVLVAGIIAHLARTAGTNESVTESREASGLRLGFA
jgi:O-antigen ligase